MSQTPDTIVHLLRHGEVHNPAGVLYGRIEGFHLSDRGHAMAKLAAESLKGRNLSRVVASPLQRTLSGLLELARIHTLTS